MSDIVFHDECAEIIEALRPLAGTVRVESAFWLQTPDGAYEDDNGSYWCGDCARTKLDDLQAKDAARDGEYFIDGGWITEHETPPHCAGCGVKLKAILLADGALDELQHFRENPPEPSSASHAYEISEMLSALEYSTPDVNDFVAEAVAIATAFVHAEGSHP